MREDVSTMPRSLEGETFLAVRARDGLSIVSLIAVFGMVVSMGDLSDAVIVTPLFVAALFVPSVLAFAAGQLALLPTVTVEDTLAVGITQVALLLVLVEPARKGVSRTVIVGTAFTYGVLSVGVVVGLGWGSLAAGTVLVGTVAIVIYLLHRLVLVRFGLVTSTGGPNRPVQDGPDGGRSTNQNTTAPDGTAVDRSVNTVRVGRDESVGTDANTKD